jgi:tetratricopeptide (TPR) repeat protein
MSIEQDSLVELGIILLSMDENEDALKVFERALKLRREERDESFAQEDIDESNLKIAKVLNNIGCVNFEAGSFGDARRSFDDAIELQKTVFKSWINLVCGVDGNSPGILTMASTMCNKAYVEIEQDRFTEAIALLEESLKIQRSVLGTDNKLVQSTLDNLGYAYFMLAKPVKALNAYENIWSAMRGSKDCLEEKLDVVKKMVICHISLEQWSLAFPLLEAMEDMQRELETEAVELQRIQKLMGEVNYQIFKLPSLSSATNRALGCAVCMGPDEEDICMDHWVIEKPDNTSKMSGHRVTHA